MCSAMSVSTVGCNSSDMCSEPTRSPHRLLCPICANIDTVFPTKSFYQSCMSHLENIFSCSMYRQRFARKHFFLNLTVPHEHKQNSKTHIVCGFTKLQCKTFTLSNPVN
jgi:hypothetical protein